MSIEAFHLLDDQLAKSLQVGFLGPPLSEGPLPALFYFALSLEDSLLTAPFNTPALIFSQARVFSVSLPMHQRGQNEQGTLALWVEKILQGDCFIDHFLDQLEQVITRLAPWVTRWSFAGLSRGAWIACHLCHRLSYLADTTSSGQATSITLFAPLTRLDSVQPQLSHSQQQQLQCSDLHKLDLSSYRLWVSIGHQDTRVQTNAAFDFFHSQLQRAPAKKRDHRLVIYPSIGYKGHGTPDSIFEEGINWLKRAPII